MVIGSVIVGAIVTGVALTYATRSGHPDTVVVPGVRGGGFPFAFDRLRERGLRVAIPATLHLGATTPPMVAEQTPPAGTRVKWDSVVTLRTSWGPIGSPSGPDELPVYRVPEFHGKALGDAVAWTKGKTIYWETDLPPLPPSSAKHLFDAYVVRSQRPTAGSGLKLWIRVPGRGVRLTPLALDVALR
jgi:PASTA domain